MKRFIPSKRPNLTILQRLIQKEIGEIFGVSRITIRQWVKYENCPINDDETFNLREVIAWYKNRLLKQKRTKKRCLICRRIIKNSYIKKASYCKSCWLDIAKMQNIRLDDCIVKARIKLKYGIPVEFISDDMISRERDLIQIGRLFRKENRNGRAKKIN